MSSGPIDVGNVQTISGYTFDEMLQKMIDAGFNSGGGSSSITSNWPVKSDLTLGNTLVWAGNRWIVAHVTDTEAYLVLESATGQSGTFYGSSFGGGNGIQEKCNAFLTKFTQEQTSVLKSVVADETVGLVFCPTRAQYSGGFEWFTSNERRKVGVEYWTSTYEQGDNRGTWSVTSNGSLSKHTIGNATSDPADFRPAVCVDLTLYDQ